MPRRDRFTEGTLPANRIENVRRRANRIRDKHGFAVTCPASRHVHMIADALSSRTAYDRLPWEQDHIAGSLYAVLESLWKDRAKGKRQ